MISVFSLFTMNHLTLRNRPVRSATWEGIAKTDGSLPEEAYEIYDELAAGGIGMIISGFTSVASNDHSFGGMMRLCDDHLIPQCELHIPNGRLWIVCSRFANYPALKCQA